MKCPDPRCHNGILHLEFPVLYWSGLRAVITDRIPCDLCDGAIEPHCCEGERAHPEPDKREENNGPA